MGLGVSWDRPREPNLTVFLGGQIQAKSIAMRISEFGKKAGVVVNTQAGRTASAHDIRASFLTHRLATSVRAI